MPRHTFSDVSMPIVMAWGDRLGPVVATTHPGASGCGTLFPGVRKHCAGHCLTGHPWHRLPCAMRGYVGIRNSGSAAETAEGREPCPSPSKGCPSNNAPALPTHQSARQRAKATRLEESATGRCCPLWTQCPPFCSGTWGGCWTSMAPLFPSFLLFFTT